jgi:hypothetical protein
VRPKHTKASEIREALRALLSDIEGMYEGEEHSTEDGQLEEFFGPFSVSRQANAELDAGTSVSWPNLAISMRNAKNILREADADDVRTRP